MKRMLIWTVVLALGVAGVPLAAQQQGGAIRGIVLDACQQMLPGVRVQLRDVNTGALVGLLRSDKNGKFSFDRVVLSNYVIEIVNEDGSMGGVSASIAVALGAVVTGVTVASSTACGPAAAAATGSGGSFFTSTAGIIVLGAAAASATAAAVAGARPAKGGASASR